MDTCEQCGQEHIVPRGATKGRPSCKGHHQGRPCQRSPMKGQRVCSRHGGKTPNALVAGAVRIEEQKARGMLARLGDPDPIRHPVYELLDLAAEMKAGVAYFRERVSELQSLHTVDSMGTEKERAVVLLYERAIDRFSKHLVDIARLDLQTRWLAIQQLASTDVLDGVVKALRQIGLADHEDAFRAEFAKVIRETRPRDTPPGVSS